VFNSRKITALASQGSTPAFDQYYFQGGRALQLTTRFAF
jgi:hypothetical protein